MKSSRVPDGLQAATAGAGPLLQRDYWAILRDTDQSPQEIITYVRNNFSKFPPESLVSVEEISGKQKALELNDEIRLRITPTGPVEVRVIHVNDHSFTLATKEGHPEAGRITFGAYRSEQGDIIFHIRSRARSGSSTKYAGFLTAGDPMQINTWTDFIDRLAHMFADGVAGAIHVETGAVQEVDADELLDAPTYLATGV